MNAIDFVKDFADEPCTYHDNCTPEAQKRHGMCRQCRARQVLRDILRNDALERRLRDYERDANARGNKYVPISVDTLRECVHELHCAREYASNLQARVDIARDEWNTANGVIVSPFADHVRPAIVPVAWLVEAKYRLPESFVDEIAARQRATDIDGVVTPLYRV